MGEYLRGAHNVIPSAWRRVAVEQQQGLGLAQTTQPQMTEPPGSSEAANPSAAADDQGAMRAVLSGWRSTVSSMVTSVTGL